MERERAIALTAFGAIAVHVVDDSFLQPQPGTSAADHLLSGLALVAVLLATALAYGRLNAGARAFMAATVGALAVAGGVADAVYPAVHVSPSGDDFSGFVAAVAGAVLVVTAAVTLWRSRHGGGAVRRFGRRALIAFGAFVFAVWVVYPVGLAYVATHSARADVPAARLGAPHREARFLTSDGLQLAGWYVPSRNGAAVIVSPGRSPAVQRHAAMLVRHGYGVLVFDRRGEGKSEGDPNTFGWAGDRDLEAALGYLRSRQDVDPARVGGLGLSVGGEMLLQTAAETHNLRAVVSEGAGARSFREAVHVPWSEKWTTAPFFAIATTATAVFGNDTPPPDLSDMIPRIAPRPIFLIYAQPGKGGEAAVNPVFAAAARGPAALWRVPGAGHTGGLSARPREYERRVVRFFDRALGPAHQWKAASDSATFPDAAPQARS